ncbi:hypothetical protein POUND7_016184 [Theobroma cacao]
MRGRKISAFQDRANALPKRGCSTQQSVVYPGMPLDGIRIHPMAALAPTSLSKDPLSNGALTRIFGSRVKSLEIRHTQLRLWTCFRRSYTI